MQTILVVDDEKNYLVVLEDLLRGEGYEVVTVNRGEKAVEICRSADIDLLLTDMKMPGMDGMTLLSEVSHIDPDLPIIMMTAYATVEQAVKAMKIGAFDYVMKPFRNEELLALIGQALQVGELRRQHRRLRTQASSHRPLISQSPVMQEVHREIERVAQVNSSVIITGESGTGKEYIARTIHDASLRASRPFIAVNCAAIPEGLLESELFGHQRGAFTGAVSMRKGMFERADRGTLFLDEIGEMAPSLQAKLLRILQERTFERLGGTETIQVDVRVVSATNRNLKQLVDEGEFREDLYYRLNVFQIALPPLRERREDIIPLANHFAKTFAAEMGKMMTGLAPEAEQALLAYPWPGNVRELQNVMERALVLANGNILELEDLSPDIRSGVSVAARRSAESFPDNIDLNEALDAFERRILLEALSKAGGVQAQAARALGISRSNIQYRLNRLGLRSSG